MRITRRRVSAKSLWGQTQRRVRGRGDNADVNNNFMTSAATRDFILRASNAHGGLHPEPPPSAVLYSGDRAAADAARANNAIAAQRRRISPGGGEDAAANAAA